MKNKKSIKGSVALGNTFHWQKASMRNFWIAGAMVLGFALLWASSMRIFSFLEESSFMQALVSPVGSNNRPNVIVIMADDLEVGAVNTLLSKGLMPNLQQYIINSGTTFSNSFVTTSLCCPSRATFLTGKYSHNTGVYDNNAPTGGVTKFDDVSTLATWLQTGGYRTGYIGKYLNGYGTNDDPNSPKDDPTYIPPGWSDWQGLIDGSTYNVYGYKINDNGTVIKYGSNAGDYQTDVLALRATEFINESEAANDEQPFFLSVMPLAPHLENNQQILSCVNKSARWQDTIRPAPRHIGTLPASIGLAKPPSFNEQDLSDKPAWFQSRFLAMTAGDVTCANLQYRDRLESILSVDDLIGSIFQTLTVNKELENTVVIFTSDNGWFSGEHRLRSKYFGYEESIRVPLYVRAPQYPSGVRNKAVLSNDLAPTIVSLAKITPDTNVDGRSFISIIKDKNATWRKRFLVEFLGQNYIQTFSGVRSLNDDQVMPNSFYALWSDASEELYDLTSDPYQIQSVNNNPTFTRQGNILNSFLAKLSVCSGEVCRKLEDGSGADLLSE